MQIRIVGRQPFHFCGVNQISVSSNEGQGGEACGEILLMNNQSRRKMDSIIAAQPIMLSQANRPIENERVRSDQAIFACAVNRQQIDSIVSFLEGYTARRADALR